MKKVLMAAGGTGGHIYPAISVAERLVEKEVEVIFAGSRYRMERKIIPQHKFPFFAFPIARLGSVKGVVLFIISTLQAIVLLKKERVDVVFGWGNYTMVPFLIAAMFWRKPFYLHEQNVNLGAANRIFYRFSKRSFLSFELSFDQLAVKHAKKIKVVGNPIRKEFYEVTPQESRERLGIDENAKMILLFGGSLGAKALNEGVLSHLEWIESTGVQFYWVVGKHHYEEVVKRCSKTVKNVKVFEYLPEIYHYMSAADLIISRSGASTIFELFALEKPSILIPFDYVGQTENARVLEERKMAFVYSNQQVDKALIKAIEMVEDPKLLSAMKRHLREFKRVDVVDTIIENLDIWR